MLYTGNRHLEMPVFEKLLERGEQVVVVCTAPDKDGHPHGPLKETAGKITVLQYADESVLKAGDIFI